MSTIRYTSDDVTIRSDEECLAEIDAAISAVLTAGQAYTIFGSRTVTRSNLAELQKQKAIYERRILHKKGWTGRNMADNSRTASDDVPRS